MGIGSRLSASEAGNWEEGQECSMMSLGPPHRSPSASRVHVDGFATQHTETTLHEWPHVAQRPDKARKIPSRASVQWVHVPDSKSDTVHPIGLTARRRSHWAPRIARPPPRLRLRVRRPLVPAGPPRLRESPRFVVSGANTAPRPPLAAPGAAGERAQGRRQDASGRGSAAGGRGTLQSR